jgi:hypothetical protein
MTKMTILLLAALALPSSATAQQRVTEDTVCAPREYAQYHAQASSGQGGAQEVARGYCLDGVIRRLHRELAANLGSNGFTLEALRQQHMADACHAEMRKAADALIAVGFLKDAWSMRDLPDCGEI